ncbi:MAG TPA: AI-2E family transporter [Oligoflexia bacterium]|nr:AI-2E family transporter [Oligoflexia bacterium]
MASPFSSILGNVLSSVAGVLTGVLGLFVIPLLAFYLLRDFPKLGGRLMRIIPRNKQRMVQDLRDRLDLVLGGFLRGQLLVSGLLSTYYVFAFLVLGIDLALVLGVLAGVLNLVPYVGIMIVIAMTTLLALLHGATAATFIALGIVFAIGMAVEGVFLTPKIVGNRVGLRPLSILIALMCGGELFGFVGMLLAIPTAATVKVFIEYWIEQRV